MTREKNLSSNSKKLKKVQKAFLKRSNKIESSCMRGHVGLRDALFEAYKIFRKTQSGNSKKAWATFLNNKYAELPQPKRVTKAGSEFLPLIKILFKNSPQPTRSLYAACLDYAKRLNMTSKEFLTALDQKGGYSRMARSEREQRLVERARKVKAEQSANKQQEDNQPVTNESRKSY